MPRSDAQRRAQNKYDAANYTMIGCKVRREYADRFREACAAMNTTPAAVFKAAADNLLSQYNNAAPDGAATTTTPAE